MRRLAAKARLRRGMTLVEILLAALLASFVMVAVVRFVDVSLSLWSSSEDSRTRHGRAHVILERLAMDLETTHPGQLGDFLAEWVPYDLGGDSAAERVLPRLRWVRRPGALDWRRLTLEALTEEQRREYLEMGFGIGSPAAGEDASEDQATGESGAGDPAPPADWQHRPGLAEVFWILVPTDNRDSESAGSLFRMEQKLVTGPSRQGVIESDGPSGGASETEPREALLSDGVLWLGLTLRGEDTVSGTIGSGPGQSRAAWDALGRGRPDGETVEANRTAVQVPGLGDQPVLPRQIRLQLEIESAEERERRPRLLDALDREQTTFELTRGDDLPASEDLHLRVGAEWMRVVNRDGDNVTVERGQRGTLASLHAQDTRVHFGLPVVRTVLLPTARMRPPTREVSE